MAIIQEMMNESDPDVIYWEKKTTLMWEIWGSTILVLGIIGNLLVLVFMYRLRKMSVTNTFLMAMAVADLLLLCIAVFPKWYVFHYGTTIFSSSDMEVFCKLKAWCGRSMGMLSSNLIAAVAVQRTIGAVWPHRFQTLCKRRRMKQIIGIMAVAAFLINIFALFVATMGPKICQPKSSFQNSDYFVLVIFLNMLFFAVLPATVIIVSDCCLIRAMAGWGERAADGSQREVRRQIRSSTTTMVVALSIVFLVTRIPVAILRLVVHFQYAPNRSPATYFVKQVAKLLFFTNSAINFYLYICTGRKFRRQVWAMVCRPAGSSAEEEPRESVSGLGRLTPSGDRTSQQPTVGAAASFSLSAIASRLSEMTIPFAGPPKARQQSSTSV